MQEMELGCSQSDKKAVPDMDGEGKDSGNMRHLKDPEMFKANTKKQNTFLTSSVHTDYTGR